MINKNNDAIELLFSPKSASPPKVLIPSHSIARSNSQSDRLIFPKEGDSNIFWGVGKKHYGDYDFSPKNHLNLINPEQSIRKSVSVRNIMSVADI